MSMQLELEGTNIRLIDLQPADISTDFNEAFAKSDENNARIAKATQTVDRNLKAARNLTWGQNVGADRRKEPATTRNDWRCISIDDRSANLSGFAPQRVSPLGD